jgi:hypothetical protein
MTSSVPTADTRNLSWKSNNIGSQLLQRMGWQDGQAVGKRQRDDATTEGIRIRRRAEGLGLGATAIAGGRTLDQVSDLSSVLQSLQEKHAKTKRTDEDKNDENEKQSSKQQSKKKSKKSKKSTLILPTNKSTHARVRQAKFQTKSAQDLQGIFGAVPTGFSFIAAATVEGLAASKSSEKESPPSGESTGEATKDRPSSKKRKSEKSETTKDAKKKKKKSSK